MRQHVRQFMQQSRKLLPLRQSSAQRDMAPMGGAVNKIRALAAPDRCAQRRGKRLQ
jgi:hypothetical protein